MRNEDFIGWEIDIRGNVGRIVYIIGRRLHTSREGARPRSPFAPGRALPDTPNAHSLLSSGRVIIRDQGRQSLAFNLEVVS